MGTCPVRSPARVKRGPGDFRRATSYGMKKIALVHEYLNQFGGAERVLRVIGDLFPKAPIFTLIYDEKATRGIFKGREIVTSFLQKFPFSRTRHQLYPLLMPLAIEQFDFSEFDVVISLSASFAKGIIVKPHTRHICYCLTPPRFLWDNSQKFIEEFGYPWIIQKLLPPFISYLRIWDRNAAHRVDEFWAISNFVAERIKKYYRRESKVIYPPVDYDRFRTYLGARLLSKESGYYLIVGRLVSYKRFDLAIRAFNQLKLPLKIAGVGPQLKNLKRIAGPTIEFFGSVADENLPALYSGARAVIFPQEEDFGIVPLEAMAAGQPVIAYKGGGALETVINGETGIFFKKQSVESLIKAIKNFENHLFNSEECRARAKEFSIDKFKKAIVDSLQVIVN